MFLSSQQGRLRGDDGHDATAPSLTSDRTVGLPVDKPRPLSAWACLDSFSTETEQAGLTQASPELPAPSVSAEVAEGVRARDGGDGGRSR